MKRKDYLGEKFNKLTVVSEEDVGVKPSGQKYRRVKCLCVCGAIKVVHLHSLKNGNTKSCGCINKEIISKLFTKHGGCGTKLHNIYRAIRSRCYNKNNNDYKNYGGRGIVVNWSSFEEFRDDMGSSYIEGLSIERNDVNGDYCKNNCKWIPMSEQGKNKQNTLYVEYNGVNIRLIDLCVLKNKNYHTVWQRINRQNKTLVDALK